MEETVNEFMKDVVHTEEEFNNFPFHKFTSENWSNTWAWGYGGGGDPDNAIKIYTFENMKERHIWKLPECMQKLVQDHGLSQKRQLQNSIRCLLGT